LFIPAAAVAAAADNGLFYNKYGILERII